MSRQTRKRNRNNDDQFAGGFQPHQKEVVQEDRIKQFTPTKSQKEMINIIRANTLTFVDSEAGVGKSSAVLWHYCQEYKNDLTKQIVVVRTPVEFTDDKVGYLPSTIFEKCEPHFASTKKILDDFLGKGKVGADMGKRIHFKIPNYMLGSTIENSLVLIDEAQQLSPQILKLLLERIGKNSKVVVAGSSNQLFADKTNKRNALADAISRFFKDDGEYIIPRYEDVGFYEFGIEDVMRSEIVKTVIMAYKGVSGY